ncbi:zinc finger protein 154-like isoform X1 [Procambarus clarkii]|uniref:zinc finger protein 154-like isoform X1 n=1 Tax=Procambarus clarkii TaxID=6728 RepID=UPI00374396C6
MQSKTSKTLKKDSTPNKNNPTSQANNMISSAISPSVAAVGGTDSPPVNNNKQSQLGAAPSPTRAMQVLCSHMDQLKRAAAPCSDFKRLADNPWLKLLTQVHEDQMKVFKEQSALIMNLQGSLLSLQNKAGTLLKNNQDLSTKVVHLEQELNLLKNSVTNFNPDETTKKQEEILQQFENHLNNPQQQHTVTQDETDQHKLLESVIISSRDFPQETAGEDCAAIVIKKKKTHQCPQCPKVFTCPGHVKRHMLVHSGDKPHECPECGKRFNQLVHLKTHRMVHADERPFQCAECGKKFRERGTIIKHMFLHSGDKPHECLECGKRFSQHGSMKAHMLVHTGDKRHECPECGKRFSQHGGMKTHMLVHSGDKPHECPECGKRFTQRGHMNTHRMVHADERPFRCDECGKKFRERGAIIKHMLVHSGDKPHECPECGKRFRERGTMKTHMLVHSRDKAHECPECRKRFSRLGQMKKHKMIHADNMLNTLSVKDN